MKRITAISLFIVLLCLTAGIGMSFAEDSPMVRLRAGIQGIIEVLNDPQYKGHPEKNEEKAALVRERIKSFLISKSFPNVP